MSSVCLAQKPAPVDLELLTYPEVYAAIHQQGKTTVLLFNGGTEQRGPHAVLGGHTFIARAIADGIARKLGNALVAPIMPFSPTDNFVKPEWPGTISVPTDVYVKVNEAMVASMAVAGFNNIVILAEHGGGDKQLEELAHTLDAKYSGQGTHVYFCGATLTKGRDDFNAILKQRNLPISTHGGIPDTSELMYLGGDDYVRKDKIVAGDAHNGIQGDPRGSTPELGKLDIDTKIADGVDEIRRLIGAH